MRGYIGKLCLNSLKGEDYTLNFKLSGFWGTGVICQMIRSLVRAALALD